MSNKEYDEAFSQFYTALLKKGFNLIDGSWHYRNRDKKYEIGIHVVKSKNNYLLSQKITIAIQMIEKSICIMKIIIGMVMAILGN